jgi:hypothetical protein
VSQELFDDVQAIIQERSAVFKAAQGKYAHFEKRELLLKGLLFCADCGTSLYRYKSVRGGGKYCDWIYLCRVSEELKTCSSKYIHEDDLYNAVYTAIRLQTEKCADIKRIIDKLNSESSHKSRLVGFDAEIEELQKEIKRLDSLKKAVFEDYATKLLTTSEYQFATEKYNAEAERLNLRLGVAKVEKADYTENSTPVNKWLVAYSRFIDSKELTADMVKALIERIEVVERNKVTIVFKFRNEYEAIIKYAKGAA